MEKSGEIILQENLNDKELFEIKTYKKIKYSIAIIASILIFFAVVILSFMSIKKKVIEKETKPVTRNLDLFSVYCSKTYHLGSFGIGGETFVLKYVVNMISSRCHNKIVISSSSRSFEFGNNVMASTGKGSFTYSNQLFKIKLRKQFIKNSFDYFLIGKVNGTLHWDISLISGSGTTAKYSVELSGTLKLYPECKFKEESSHNFCFNKGGILTTSKGKLILSNKGITEDSDFSLKMGNLKFNIITPVGHTVRSYDFLEYFKGWCSNQ